MKWKIESQVNLVMEKILKNPDNDGDIADLVDEAGSFFDFKIVLLRTLAKFFCNMAIEHIIWEEDREVDYIIEEGRVRKGNLSSGLIWGKARDVVVRVEIEDNTKIKSIFFTLDYYAEINSELKVR